MIAGSAWEDLDAPQTAIANFITAVCQQAAIEPPAVEIKYIRFMLGTFNAKDMQNSIEWVQAQLLSIQLIQFVERETKIPFSRKEELLQEGLYKHVASLIYRVKSDIQIVNPLKDNIKRNYTKLYTVIHRFIPKIERVAGNPLTEDEVAFLTIHFSTAVSALNQDIHYIYKAVVVCNHGTATGNLLAENLKELFNIEVLAVLSSRETDVIRKLDVDIVFATAPIANVEKPVLVLEPIIKEESQRLIQHFLLQHDECKRVITHASDSTELFYAMLSIIEASGGTISKEIYQKVESVFDTHHLRLNRREIQPMLKDVLTEKNIKLHDTVSSWEEAIARVAEPLLKEGVIEEHYIDAMIRSVQEYGPYIVIGPHLALAHARPEDGVNRLGVSVITLKEPINFGNEENDPVNIVFCLATVDSYSHLTIMKHLVALINDEDKLNQLCQLDDVTAFMELLFEE